MKTLILTHAPTNTLFLTKVLNLYNGKKIASSTNGAGTIGFGHAEKLQKDPYLSPCTKLKCKWIKDLSINPATLNLLEEKVGITLEQIGTGDRFLNIMPVGH